MSVSTRLTFENQFFKLPYFNSPLINSVLVYLYLELSRGAHGVNELNCGTWEGYLFVYTNGCKFMGLQ